MTKRTSVHTSGLWFSLAALALLPSTAWGEVREGWRVDFEDGTLGGGVGPTYVIRAKGVPDNSRLDVGVANGILRLGGNFDEQGVIGPGDYAEVDWRSVGPLSITEFPVLEMRYAGPSNGSVLVMPTYQFADGSTQMPYFSLGGEGEDDWKVVPFRLAGDSSLPRKWTPRHLLSVVVWVQANQAGRVVAGIDWLRLRSFTPEEEAREKEWVRLMKGYIAPEPASLREFFPFGIYADSSNDSSLHKLGPEHGLSNLARNHLNLVLAGPLIGSYQYPDGREIPPAQEVHPFVSAVEATGLRLFLRVRTSDTFFPSPPEEARRWAESVLQEAGKSQAVLGYNFKDEPGVDHLWALAGCKRLLESADPQRPVIINLNNLFAAKTYAPYSTLICTDRYPLQRSGATNDPAELFTWCREIAQETGNKRQWVILQAFGATPWRQHGYMVPTPEQVRLMTYAALAGGARGLIYYNYNYDRYRMMADQFGNPNELFAEVGRLAEKLIPVGHRLLNATVDFETEIPTSSPDLLVGVLRDLSRRVWYVVVVNKNLKRSVRSTAVRRLAVRSTAVRRLARTRLTLPASWRDKRVYDLMALAPVFRGTADLEVAPLLPGAGRIYLVGTEEDFQQDRLAIETVQVQEILRVQTPDLTIARRYQARLTQVEALRQAAEEALRSGHPEMALPQARRAGVLLSGLMKKLEPYATLRAGLEETGRQMGSVEPAMYPDNEAFAERMASLRDPFWSLHQRWAAAFERTLQGATEGLPEEVRRIADEAQRIVARVRGLKGGGKPWDAEEETR